ncbi:MAG: glutamine--fructose-6-phosphate transaminase (isomerizing), partial [Desulfurococcales archaeon ex4484_42]
IDAVSKKIGFDFFNGTIGIGHTRWATHGAPSDINAHPHADCAGRIAVAHNGIIENYLEIKKILIQRGHRFTSDTDTEVIPHLIEEFKKLGLSSFEAFKKAISMLRGAYAIVAIDIDEPDKVFFAKMTSPLVIGFGDGANFIASDIPAFLNYTRRILVIRDGELGYITHQRVHLELLKEYQSIDDWSPKVPKTVIVDYSRRVRWIDWTSEMAVKAGYPHFMLKEIHEQPQALSQTLAGIHDDIAKVLPIITKAEKVIIVGAGTSYHASLLGSLLLNNIGGIWSHAIISSEALWYVRSITDKDVVIAVSQSGETIDTLLAVREAKKRGALVIALSNVVDSAIPRESDLTIYTKAGPEIGVAATKTFTTQVATLSYLAIKVGQAKGLLKEGEANEMIQWLKRTPDLVSRVISVHEAKVRSLARRLMNKQSAFYLGRGIGLPVSMEGALKLKEVAYIHAEAYPAGESKHGPIALVEEEFPVIFTILGRIDAELLKSNIEEMNARYAWTIGVVPKNIEELIKLLKEPIKMPVMNEYIAPIVYIVPYQLLAYYTAVTRGYDPDKPRNLAKTVTVV